jgi:hypothetical protein
MPEPLIPQDPQAEQLLSVLGVEPLLETGLKIRITQEMRQRAARVPAAIAAETRRFLAAAEPEGDRSMPDFRYRDALRLLTELDPEERIMALSDAVQEGDDVAGVIVAGGRALRHLKAILPRRSVRTVMGPKTLVPNDLVVYRFRRAYAAVQDPLGIFGDMQEGALSRDQVRTVQAVYPSLYDTASQSMILGLAELKATRPTIEFPRWKVRMVENLLLTRSWSPELARQMQAVFGKEKRPEGVQPRPSALTDKTAEASQTPVQRIANK